MIDADRLHQLMLQAHRNEDLAALPGLYLQAARLRESEGDIDAACFFFTQAYVYALDCGDTDSASAARLKLTEFGRDR